MTKILSNHEISLSFCFGLLVSLAHMFKGDSSINRTAISFILGTYIALVYFSFQKEFKNRYIFFISLSVFSAFLISLLSVHGFEGITFAIATFIGALIASLKKSSNEKIDTNGQSNLKKESSKKRVKRPFTKKRR